MTTLFQQNREKRRKSKVVKGIASNRSSQEANYRRSLLLITKELEEIVKNQLVPVIKIRESEFKNDGILTDISQMISGFRSRLTGLDAVADRLSQGFVNSVDGYQSKRFNRMIKRSAGVDISGVLRNPRISNALEKSVVSNVKLIKSIPEKYFSKIEELVFENITKGRTTGSLLSDIRGLNNSTKKRAKIIARDQTSKLLSNLNQERQQAVGIIGYQWRNSKDRRVRGNPNGLYPDSKFDHWDREGKYFLWEKTVPAPKAPNGKAYNQPPADGHPGEPIQCRCIADPVIE